MSKKLQIITKDGAIHNVWKYLMSSDGEANVWCSDWYGRHVIGYDCEFYTEAEHQAAKVYRDALEKIANSNAKIAEDKNVLKAQLMWIRSAAQQALSKAEDKGDEGRTFDGCFTCVHNIETLEGGLFCINNCNKGSMYELDVCKVRPSRTSQPTNNGWISVDDRFPEYRKGYSNSEDVNILIRHEGEYVVTTGSYSYQHKKWMEYLYNDKYNASITYWQPLPPKP